MGSSLRITADPSPYRKERHRAKAPTGARYGKASKEPLEQSKKSEICREPTGATSRSASQNGTALKVFVARRLEQKQKCQIKQEVHLRKKPTQVQEKAQLRAAAYFFANFCFT
jgi:hypothetical protein